MMNEKEVIQQTLRNENERNYKRWYLNQKDEHLSLTIQRTGLAIKVKHPWLFRYEICRGVIKDFSVGGAGLLVPAEKKLPRKIIISFNQLYSFTGLIKYSKSINDQLKFIGVEWTTKSEQERMDLVTNLQAFTK